MNKTLFCPICDSTYINHRESDGMIECEECGRLETEEDFGAIESYLMYNNEQRAELWEALKKWDGFIDYIRGAVQNPIRVDNRDDCNILQSQFNTMKNDMLLLTEIIKMMEDTFLINFTEAMQTEEF